MGTAGLLSLVSRIRKPFRTLCRAQKRSSQIFLLTILAGMVFSFEAHACDNPPAGSGTTTDTSSGYLFGAAGTTFIIQGYGDAVDTAGASATLSTAGGASFSMSVGGCTALEEPILGFYTSGSFFESDTVTVTNGYDASAAISASPTASPKNNGFLNPKVSAPTQAGEPMNVLTGNEFNEETDFVGGPTTDIELKRYYNSQAIMASPFGQGWRSTYDRTVIPLGSTYTEITRPDGSMEAYKLVSGVWTSDPDVTTMLTAVMTGSTQTGWQVVTEDDTTENYNIGGQLTSIVTRAGLTTTLAYNGSNQLTTVTGPFGHMLTYTYGTNGNVATVTIPDGGVYAYAYDTHNNLTSVTYPDTTSKSYAYTNTSYPNALTGITDELGNNYATFTYGSSPYVSSAFGIVTSSQFAGGANLTSVSYASGGPTVTDPNNNTYTYSFTTQFGVVKPTALTGQPSQTVGGKSFSYDTNGFISSKTDFDNNVTNYVHNARGLETSQTEAYGTSLARTITTTWHSTFHLPLTITEPSRTTTFTYDTNGNMLTKTVSDGTHSREWQYTYNTSGQVLTAEDPDLNTTTFTYNTNGTLATKTDAAGHVTHYTSYDADGKLLSKTDPNGLVTALTYDPRGRIMTRTVGTEETDYTYDHAGNLTEVNYPDGSFLDYTYDDAHRLTQITDALGNYTSYTLDPADNVTAENVYSPTPTLTQTRTFTFDTVERLATAVGASSQTTTYGYDNQSNLTLVEDPLSRTTSYTYDALNRRRTLVDAATNTTTYGYDSEDDLTSVQDPRSLTTTYGYDGIADPTSISSPDTGSTTKTFDAGRNILTSTDANGNETTFTNDVLNRVSTAIYQDSTTATYTYDQGRYGKGHLTTLTDAAGTTHWIYDIYGRVWQKKQTTGSVVLTVTYTHDSYGRIATITYPSGRVITLSYDDDGNVSGITEGTNAVISSVAYEPFNFVSGWTEGNSETYSRTMDTDGRISGISFGTSGGSVSLGYTFDAANRVTGLTETGLDNKSFGYDSRNHLTSLTIGTASPTSYAYDADGNRTSVTDPSDNLTTYNYPSVSNKLSSLVAYATTNYSYDSVGNMTGDGTNTWAYDARNRMASDTVSSLATNYGINALGQRITKSGAGIAGGGPNEYIYDETGHQLGEYDNTGSVIDETVWLGDLPVAVLTGTGTLAATYYINPDNLGAPLVITDVSGNPVWTWDHLAFGDSEPNQNPSSLGVFNYNVRFPGQYADVESGLS
jgi:YD repeat-containing protein